MVSQDSLFNSFITAGTFSDHKKITLCAQFFSDCYPAYKHQMFVPWTLLFRIYHNFHVWNKYTHGGKVEFVDSLPLGDGESPDLLLRSPLTPSCPGEVGCLITCTWEQKPWRQPGLVCKTSTVVFGWVKVLTFCKFCLGRLPLSWSFG